jgi:hypothetical protein
MLLRAGFHRAAARRTTLSQRRSAHFITFPPSFPAKPHPSTEAVAPYGWGDWFVASLVSSVVSWPVVFATDSFWGSYLLPQVKSMESPYIDFQAVTFASLLPKAAGSYLGAHLYCPRAWWFWKLTLIPALPLSFGISLVIHFSTVDADKRREFAEAYAGPEVPFTPHDVTSRTSQDVGSTAWRPSLMDEKSSAVRLREAAPTAVQWALKKAGLF